MGLPDHLQAELRRSDPAAYFAGLFTPEPVRRHFWAVHAFASELAGLADRVGDPAAGEIRLQWWREAIRSGESWGSPLAAALLEAVGDRHLPLPALERLLDARAADFYADAPADLHAFEGYAADTEGVALQLGALALGGDGVASGEAAGHASVALALARRLGRVGGDIRRGRLFLPADRVSAHGIDREALLAGRRQNDLAPLVAELRQLALAKVGEAEGALRTLPAHLVPALLPLAAVRPTLRRLGQGDAEVPALPQWRVQWAVWRAARRWGRGQ